jgi:hypothetical protein
MIASRPNYLLERVKERRKELRRELARVDRAIAAVTGTGAAARRHRELTDRPPMRIFGSGTTDTGGHEGSAGGRRGNRRDVAAGPRL